MGNWENMKNIFSTLSNTRRFTEMQHSLHPIMKAAGSRPERRRAGHAAARGASPAASASETGRSRRGPRGLSRHQRQCQHHRPGSAFWGLRERTPLTFSPGFASPNRASGPPPWGPSKFCALVAPEHSTASSSGSPAWGGPSRSPIELHTWASQRLGPTQLERTSEDMCVPQRSGTA